MGLGKTYSTKYLLDSNNSSGVAGQVLSTTSTGIDWVDANTVPGAGLWIESGNDIYNSNSGNVGIGTTTPGEKLEVTGGKVKINKQDEALIINAVSNNGSYILLTNSSTPYAYIGAANQIITAGAATQLGLRSQSDMLFSTGGLTERMRISSAGNVGIGTPTTSTYRFNVLKSDGNVGFFTDGTTADLAITCSSAVTMLAPSTALLAFGTSGSEKMRIIGNGNVGIGTDDPGSSGFAKLHVCNGTPATYTPNSEADTLVLESSTPGGISLIGTGVGGNAKQAIVFGTTAGPSSASIIYDGNNSKLVIGTTSASQVVKFNSGNSALALTLDASQNAIFNGNVGIGTTTIGTNDKLLIKTSVDNSVAQGLVIQRSANTDEGYINYNGGGFQFRSTDGDPIVFGTVSNEYVRIKDNGNVGIGTTIPAAKLDVVGNIKSPTNSLSATAAPTSFGAYTSEVRLIDTPNGGLKSCRVITDVYGEWILVGRFAANARATIQGVWSSESGLDTSTAQNNVTRFSADFGDSFPEEVRIMGATDFTSWRDTRTIDFVYKVPEGRKWKYFFSGGVENGMATSTKFGWGINGAYDGFGRWLNPAQNFVRMSDGQVDNPSAAYTTATTNAFNWNTANDAKITVSATRVFSGQDTFLTSGFGVDDSVSGFFDEYPSEVSNMGGGDDFSSAVWILIKLPEGASGSGGSGTNYWAANGNDISNTNSSNVGIGTDSPVKRLHVKNGTSGATNYGVPGIAIENDTNVSLQFLGGASHQLGITFSDPTTVEAGFIYYNTSTNNLQLQAQNDIIFTQTGNVGINVTNPNEKLEISGNIRLDGSVFFSNSSVFNKILLNGTDMEIWSGALFPSIDITNTGLLKFGAYALGGAGTPTKLLGVDSSGNVLTTVSGSDLPGGPYLPLAGGTMTGGLNLHYAVTPTIELKDTTNNKTLLIGVDDNNAFIRSGVDEIFLLQVNGGDPAITMLNNSYVGIGTTSPLQKLHLDGNNYNTATRTTFLIRDLGNNYDQGDNAVDIVMRSRYWSGDQNTSQNSKIRHIKDNSNGSTGTQLRFSTTTRGAGDSSDKMTILASGNVGIGTTSPSDFLEIEGDADVYARIHYTGNGSTTPADVCGIKLEHGRATWNIRNTYGGGGSTPVGTFSINRGTQANALTILNNNSSDVGIGTDAPTAKLHVDGSDFLVSNGNEQAIYVDLDNYIYKFGDISGGETQSFFQIDSADSKAFFSNCDVGIGTSSPNVPLDVTVSDGGSSFNDGAAQFSNTTTNSSGGSTVINVRNNYGGGNGTLLKFFRTSTASSIGFISFNGSGNAVVYSTTSDYRLKEDLKSFNGLEIIDQIKTYNYKWKKDNSRGYGTLAHELQEIFPDAVTGEKDAEDMQGVDYSTLVPVLIKSVQELKKEIELLKQQLNK